MNDSSLAAILTYHRILTQPDMRPAFHDISWEAFEDQMRCVARFDQSNGRLSEVCVTFDDGTSDHERAGDLLDLLGLSGVFFVITGRLGRAGYLTREQTRRLADQGHRIGSHCVTHTPLTRLQPDEVETELRESKRELEDVIGRPVDWVAPPGGLYTREILARALDEGYSVFRTMEWGYAHAPFDGCVSCWPVLPRRNKGSFRRILDGRAGTWTYDVKNAFKKMVGEHKYTQLRNRFLTALR